MVEQSEVVRVLNFCVTVSGVLIGSGDSRRGGRYPGDMVPSKSPCFHIPILTQRKTV